ncbi:putative fluoride ion transporter CrcB [Geothrix rubra]|uniref:Fluoride-specific ion channel FluC n=1 Tax=Geothrix rubra TaxID=2927977 RepID=A0ABQ5Q3X7_9BACT|nr:fluoride efflux transporter CrcB [Geothrix rubra]GLH69387.1 putative fluoride ion transporter CrcB [Geothrix rubra]
MGVLAFLAVGLGAALGAWLRWGLGNVLNAAFPTLPMGTLTANLLGGYVIGLAVAYFGQHPGLSPEARLFIITGFLGGLTTFSTFSAEAVGLLTRGEVFWALVHMGSHLGGSLLLTWLGMLTVKAIL